MAAILFSSKSVKCKRPVGIEPHISIVPAVSVYLLCNIVFDVGITKVPDLSAFIINGLRNMIITTPF